MERIPDSRYSELISEAYSCIPPNIVKLVDHVHFFCGTDPVYAGLVKDNIFHVEGKQCSTRDWIYYLHPNCTDWIISRDLRYPTIVIPSIDKHNIVAVDILHELGHALDFLFPFSIENILPVTEYAKVDNLEAFAEAFCSWRLYDYGDEPSEEITTFFESLKAGESIE